MVKVLVTDIYTQESLAFLESQGGYDLNSSKDVNPTEEELKGVQALLIRSRTQIDKDLLSIAPELKMVISATSGTDHIDYDLCESHGIKIFNTTEANAQSAAELTFFLMLSLAKKLNSSTQKLIDGHWRSDFPRGAELFGKTLGIVGLGRVGGRVARMAAAFGMKVKAHDPYINKEDMSAQGVEALGLSELLRLSDIVSLHVPLNSETQRMINKNNLVLMSEQAYLINASRGGVVDENDLMDFLQSGRLAGAGLDVYRTEPLPKGSRLKLAPHIVMTPHVGAYTEEALGRASIEAVNILIKNWY